MSFAFTVTVKDEPRRSMWLEYLETDTLPIINGLPTLANVPGHPETRVYLVDYDLLGEQLQRGLVRMLADNFDMTQDEVREELAAWSRVPVLADGVVVFAYGWEEEDGDE